MTTYTFPTPLERDIHFDYDDSGTVHRATVKLGDDELVFGIKDGLIRIAGLPAGDPLLCGRDAIFIAWALSALGANPEVRW